MSILLDSDMLADGNMIEMHRSEDCTTYYVEKWGVDDHLAYFERFNNEEAARADYERIKHGHG